MKASISLKIITSKTCLNQIIPTKRAVGKQTHPISDGVAEEFVRERIDEALKKEYIPDNMLYVLYHKDGVYDFDRNYYDFTSFTLEDWENVFQHEGISLVFRGGLQEAAFCAVNDIEPTMANLNKASVTYGFREFRQAQKDKCWEYQENLIATLPPEKRYDDWSFVFPMTDRKFTDEEKRDIQALGSMMNSGIHEELLTEERFPSLDLIRTHLDNLNILKFGNIAISSRDISRQYWTLCVEAAKVLSDLYPEVAPVIKDMSGLPTGQPGNEVYGLLKKHGGVAMAGVSGSDLYGFNYFVNWGLTALEDNGRAFIEDYKFIRYRFDDVSLMPAPR